MTGDRICCDGQCSQGRACPLTANLRCPAGLQRLAPGVIEGPFTTRSSARTRAAMLLALVDHFIGLPRRKEPRR